MNPRPEVRKLLINLSLLAASVLFSLFCFELYLRAVHSEHFLGGHAYYDTEMKVYRLIPNKEMKIKYPEFEYVLKSNSKSLRDYEYTYEKKKNNFRIIFFGDSFTFGQGVELQYTIAKQLEKKMQKQFGVSRVEVINMGMEGYGTDDCYNLLIHEGYKYQPDLVIYVFNITDFNDVFSKVKAGAASSQPVTGKAERTAPRTYVNPKQFLQHSYLYHFFLNNLKKISIIRNYFYQHGVSRTGGPLYYLEQYIQPVYGDDAQQAVSLCFDYLSKMDAYCKSKDAAFWVVYLPDYFQSYYKITQSGGGSGYDKEYDVQKPQRLIREFCAAKSIPFIDVTPFFIQQARSRRLYYDSDRHCTGLGYSLTADSIYDQIVRSGVVK